MREGVGGSTVFEINKHPLPNGHMQYVQRQFLFQ